jgi:hypothetical protein
MLGAARRLPPATAISDLAVRIAQRLLGLGTCVLTRKLLRRSRSRGSLGLPAPGW